MIFITYQRKLSRRALTHIPKLGNGDGVPFGLAVITSGRREPTLYEVCDPLLTCGRYVSSATTLRGCGVTVAVQPLANVRDGLPLLQWPLVFAVIDRLTKLMRHSRSRVERELWLVASLRDWTNPKLGALATWEITLYDRLTDWTMAHPASVIRWWKRTRWISDRFARGQTGPLIEPVLDCPAREVGGLNVDETTDVAHFIIREKK